jgi:hypothetical protein
VEIFQKGTTQFLQVIVQDAYGAPVHGATVHARLFRNSDSYYLDTATNTFVNSGGNSDMLLIELPGTGLYRVPYDQTLDGGGVERSYTAIYQISTPYASTTFDTLYFYDTTLTDIKGTGWGAAVKRPTLMNLANKDGNYTYDPTQSSLETISELITPTGAGSAENYNTEGF